MFNPCCLNLFSVCVSCICFSLCYVLFSMCYVCTFSMWSVYVIDLCMLLVSVFLAIVVLRSVRIFILCVVCIVLLCHLFTCVRASVCMFSMSFVLMIGLCSVLIVCSAIYLRFAYICCVFLVQFLGTHAVDQGTQREGDGAGGVKGIKTCWKRFGPYSTKFSQGMNWNELACVSRVEY